MHTLNKRAIFSLGFFLGTRLLRAAAIGDVNHVQNRQNLHLVDTIYTLGKAVKAREDHIDELICGVTVLQTTSCTIRVHLRHESLELFAVKNSILVHVSSSKCRINFGHERL